MLATEFHIQTVFKPRQGLIFVSRDGHSRGLVARRVHLDLMLDGIVIEIICAETQHVSEMQLNQ